MKNEHLVPPIVIDIANKINDQLVHINERNNYILRLEAIKIYCEEVLNKVLKKKI